MKAHCLLAALALLPTTGWSAGAASLWQLAAVSGISQFQSTRNQGDSYALPTGRVVYQQMDNASYTRGYRPQEEKVVIGDHERRIYDYPASASATGVFSTIKRHLESRGFSVLYSCQGAECGKSEGWRALLTPLAVGPDNSQAYLVGSIERWGSREYAAFYVNEVDDRPRVVGDYLMDQTGVDALLHENANDVAGFINSGAELFGEIPFELGSHRSHKIPDDLASKLQTWEQTHDKAPHQLTVVGYTDETGGLKLNHQLAMERAKFVGDYLAARLQIPRSSITVKALGPLQVPQAQSAASADGTEVPPRRVEVWGLSL